MIWIISIIAVAAGSLAGFAAGVWIGARRAWDIADSEGGLLDVPAGLFAGRHVRDLD
jgi:hypothetical protein